MILNAEIVFLISILYLQVFKTKEIVNLIMLTTLSSHDKRHRTVFVTQLMDQVMYHYSIQCIVMVYLAMYVCTKL